MFLAAWYTSEHPLQTSVCPKPTSAYIKMMEQLVHRSLLKCIVSILLKFQWIRIVVVVVEVEDIIFQITENRLSYISFVPLWIHTINDSNQYCFKDMRWYKDKNSFQT